MRPTRPHGPTSCLLVLAFAAAGCAPEGDLMTGPSGLPSGESPALATTAASGICDYDPVESALTGPGWTKVLEEGFSGDLSKWTIWYGGAFNQELQLYQAANLQTANGILTITAREEPATGPTTPFDPAPRAFSYTSGRIESRTHFSASTSTPKVRFSSRLRLPAGYGMWPAFWTYGDPWPTQGEIDIMEGRGQEPFQYQTAYWYGRRPGQNLVQNSAAVIVSNASLADCWHVLRGDLDQEQPHLPLRWAGGRHQVGRLHPQLLPQAAAGDAQPGGRRPVLPRSRSRRHPTRSFPGRLGQGVHVAVKIPVTVWHLELANPLAFTPSDRPPRFELRREHAPSPALARSLYAEVGGS